MNFACKTILKDTVVNVTSISECVIHIYNNYLFIENKDICNKYNLLRNTILYVLLNLTGFG